MRRTRPAYPPEFRAQIVALARAGRSVEDLAREFEPCAHTIRGWIRSTDRARAGGSPLGAPAGLSDDEGEELRRLRKENRQLRQERDILAKGEPLAAIGPRTMANAWFAQSDVTSSRSSTS
jgi:transposase